MFGIDRKWLESLKPGDKVAVAVGSWGDQWVFLSIERVTKTQFVMINGAKYRRSDGNEIGGSHRSIEPITDEIRATMRDKKRRAAALELIEAARWRDESTATLEAVAAVLRTAKETA